MGLPFFLKSKRSEDSYEEIQGAKFFVHKGEKGKNALLAAEQAKLDEVSDKFSPGFSLVAKLARKIAEAEGIKLTRAYNVIISSENYEDLEVKYQSEIKRVIDKGGLASEFAKKLAESEKMDLARAVNIANQLCEQPKIDYQEIRLKYASDIGEMSVQLERESSAKKMAVCTVAIANRCWQAMKDELDSLPDDALNRSELLGAIQEIKMWSDSDTENRLSWGYIEDVWAFIERQRNGGKDPESAEAQEITEEEIKKASRENLPEPTGEKSSGESKGSGRQKTDSNQKVLVANLSG